MTTAKPNLSKGYAIPSSHYDVDKFQSNALKLIPNACVTKKNYHRIKTKKLLPLTALMLAVLSINSAHSVLSATTAQTIKGTVPYFTLGGVPLTSAAELLGFTYTDASGTAGTKATADDAVNNTTIIVDPNMKMSDIKAMVPITNTSTQLSDILGANLTVADTDGDATVGNTSAIGALKAYWTKDGSVYTPSSSEKFTACSTYTLTIAITNPTTGAVVSTPGNIEALTTYGDPNNQQYAYPATAGSTPTAIYSATYTVQPKAGKLYVCYALPNLNYGIPPFDGPGTQWDPAKGFLPQTAPAKNFPTTGFYGAWFDLTVEGTTAASIINKMDSSASGSPLTGYVTSGDIKLKLVETSANVVNITLFGPRDGTVTTQTEAGAPTHAFSPTTFTLKDSSGANIYQFTIEKWFITKGVGITYSTGGSNSWSAASPYGFNGNLETPNYCANLGGTGRNYYKVPTRLDYTNSAAASLIAWNGMTGTGGYLSAGDDHYKRVIGGGLFAEWGFNDEPGNGYPLSEFTSVYFWTIEAYGDRKQYGVSPVDGSISGFEPSFRYLRAACVSP